MRFRLTLFAIAAMLTFTSIPARAHHSFAAEYDGTKYMKFTGIVTKFDMVNPHSWIYVDVKDESGKVVNWKFETASPSNLFRRGFKKDTLKPGMQVTIEGYLAKDGSPTANGQKLYLPDGSLIVLGTEVNPG
jgi:hypothetical protein